MIARTCRCGKPATLYPGGVWCDDCRPFPANPAPDPALTMRGMQEAAGIRPGAFVAAGQQVIDDRAILSGKKRGSKQAVKDARLRAGLPVDRNVAPVGHAHPATAKAAAADVLPRTGTIRRLVYDMIASRGGLTDDELEENTGRTHQSVSAARNTLMNDGLIVDSGRTRLTRSRHEAIVWVIQEEAT